MVWSAVIEQDGRVVFDAPLILNFLAIMQRSLGHSSLFSFTQTIYLSSSSWERPELPLTTTEQAASQDLISESAMNQIWSHFETKLNDWISNTLPRLTKDLIMSYGRSAVDEYVSSTQFKKSLPENLQFEVGNLQETTKSWQETIADLEEANDMLRKQLDDLEQYTRRTDIQIFGIPEPTGTDPENTDAKAIDFFANQLGITVSSDHISRSHRTGKRGCTPRPIIVRLVPYTGIQHWLFRYPNDCYVLPHFLS